MGASGAIVAAFVLYLVLELPQRRAGLLLTMLETLVLTVIAAFPIYLTAFDGWNGFNPVPLVCAVLAARPADRPGRAPGPEAGRRPVRATARFSPW